MEKSAKKFTKQRKRLDPLRLGQFGLCHQYYGRDFPYLFWHGVQAPPGWITSRSGATEPRPPLWW